MGGVVVIALAIGFAMFAVALAAWYSGRSAGSRTVAARTAVSYPTVSPLVAAGAHDFTRFACSQCHGRVVPGSGRCLPGCPGAGQAGTVALGGNAHEGDRAWRRRSEQSDQAVHASVARHHLSDPDSRASGVPPRWTPVGGGHGCATRPDRTGRRGRRRDSVHHVRVHELPRPQRPRRGTESSIPDQTIPSLATADFRSEFNTEQKIRNVIVAGSVIGRAPIVSMPHWGGILTDTQVRQLIAYLRSLEVVLGRGRQLCDDHLATYRRSGVASTLGETRFPRRGMQW